MKTIQVDGREEVVGNIFCIGRNYRDHVKELSSSVPDEPVVFLKPSSALLRQGEPIVLPTFSQNVHYECELLLYISRDCNLGDAEKALDCVGAYGVGLDLTARDIQNELKEKGLPWTKAKGFRGAACVSHFLSFEHFVKAEPLSFSLLVNDELRQQGCSSDMMFSIDELVTYLSKVYSLRQGDIVFTGTPAGVGKLYSGDTLHLSLADGAIEASFSVR